MAEMIVTSETLRRGQRLGWTWAGTGPGAAAQARGLAPAGRLITVADDPGLTMNLGLRVDDDPGMILDPVRAIAAGKVFTLLEDAPIPNVLNVHKHGRNPPGAVYIGRPSDWGNPFSIGEHGDRAAVLATYIDWLHETPDFVDRVRRDLAGKDLLCWCAPKSCHGDILRDLALGKPVPERAAVAQSPQPDLFGPG